MRDGLNTALSQNRARMPKRFTTKQKRPYAESVEVKLGGLFTMMPNSAKFFGTGRLPTLRWTKFCHENLSLAFASR